MDLGEKKAFVEAQGNTSWIIRRKNRLYLKYKCEGDDKALLYHLVLHCFVISAFISIWLALTSHMFQITMEILLPSLCVDV